MKEGIGKKAPGNREAAGQEINLQGEDSTQHAKDKRKSVFNIYNSLRDTCYRPDTERLFLFLLATYCDADGHCFPGNEKLTKAAQLSERSVRRRVATAERRGDINVFMVGKERHIFVNYPIRNVEAQERFKARVYHGYPATLLSA
jgi:Helix-turn-helix domain